MNRYGSLLTYLSIDNRTSLYYFEEEVSLKPGLEL